MINFVFSLILAAWVGAIAILSVQNAAPISLKFLQFQSIQMPIGVVLAFSVGIGMLGMAILSPLWKLAGPSLTNSHSEDFYEDETLYDNEVINPQQRTRPGTPNTTVTDDWLENPSDEW